MKPLLFLVADKNMEYALRGFFERDGWDRAVPCRRFEFDVDTDIRVAVGHNDPGLYARANELLRPFRGRYRRVVVMVDAEWEGSPGAEAIRQRIREHIAAAGWPPEQGLALVFEPEMDVWLWSDSPHAAAAMGWSQQGRLRSALRAAGLLDPGEHKPRRPKEAAEWALRRSGKPRSSAIYGKIAAKVSVKRCHDPTLRELLEALRTWFPV